MNDGPKTWQEMMDQVVDMCNRWIMQGHETPMTVIVGYGDNSQGAVAIIEDVPNEFVERVSMLTEVGTQIAATSAMAEEGDPCSAFIVSEAWALRFPEGVDRKDMPRPSDSPDRVEVAVYMGYEFKTGKKSLAVYDIIRTPTGVDLLLSLETTSPQEADTPLLDALVAGLISS